MSNHHPEPHPSDHASDDAGHDEHASHAAAVLGPIDWPAWAMAVVGGALALIVAASLVIAAHPLT